MVLWYTDVFDLKNLPLST